ncbi:MAG: DNA mismatch repair endonuclease MutL [Christensenellaceae bacterium]|jgi:DNA mismatch repair protein MutL|nr:DNA mismatch repair endonuclease MutL [Christensenellaceae bacterium]
MEQINILQPAVYNLLSAGEVVENPASVVKELLDNSIDAGATKIVVEIINGGIDEIIVRDNGIGCEESEIPKVFLPHATSKIRDAADIDNITSLGFRGEAMASINAVSRCEFKSKTGDGHGTSVRVQNLFYNTPARRKFLKSSNTEKNYVTQVIHNTIFTNPAIHIKYIIDGRDVIDFRGSGLKDAVKEIWGIENLLALDRNTFGLSGFISSPKQHKNNKSRQIVIVNNRVIDGGIIQSTINEACSDYLMVGRFPVFVVNLQIDPKKIDVNVHPQKREIRFQNKDEIMTTIRKEILDAMDRYFLAEKKIAIQKHQTNVMESIKFFTQDTSAKHVESAPNLLAEYFFNKKKYINNCPVQTALPKDEPTDLEIFGQLYNCYLIIKYNGELWIIDQHAYQERINYDKLMKKQSFASQILLEPIVLRLSPYEMINFEKLDLDSMGFDAAIFGNDCIKISAVPFDMKVTEFLHLILGEKNIMRNGETVSVDQIKDKIALAACRMSIKQGHFLSNEQIKLFISNNGYSVPLCPHGRPILLKFDKNKLEKMFGRI